jgi:FtsH-binding integral membrane protein
MTDTVALPLAEPVEVLAELPAAESSRWLALGVTGSALAGALHLWAAVNHAEDGARYIVFFVVAALAQFMLAGLLAHRRHPVVVLGGALGTLALITLYVASRVTDLPTVGAHQHGAEVPLSIQVAAVVTELATVVALSTVVGGRWRSWMVNAAALCGAGLWALWLYTSAT